jgi:hypothetical protein
MQSLPEKGSEVDDIPEESALKRQKPSWSCEDKKPAKSVCGPTAGVPKWLIYDDQQRRCFGSPRGHESDYSYLYSQLHYADEWVDTLIGNISSLYPDAYVADDIYLILDLDWISEQRTFTLTVSHLIFYHYVVLHRIHELVFWTLLWECSCRNIEMLVISNPLPLVRQAFLKLTHTYRFYFLTNPGGDLILDISIIRLIMSRIPDEVKATGCMRLKKYRYGTDVRFKNLPIAPDIPDGIISQNYLDNFEYFLSRIVVAKKGEGGRYFNCEVARVCIDLRLINSTTRILSMPGKGETVSVKRTDCDAIYGMKQAMPVMRHSDAALFFGVTYKYLINYHTSRLGFRSRLLVPELPFRAVPLDVPCRVLQLLLGAQPPLLELGDA